MAKRFKQSVVDAVPHLNETKERLAEKGAGVSTADASSAKSGSGKRFKPSVVEAIQPKIQTASSFATVNKAAPAYEQYKQVTEGLEAGQKKLDRFREELETLRSAYTALPTEANAKAYNHRLEQFNNDLKEYNDLVEQYNYFNSAEGIKARVDELTPLVEAAEKERNGARTVLSGLSRYGTEDQREAWSAKLEAAEADYETYSKELDGLAAQYYYTENQAKRERLDADEAMANTYSSAKTLQEDMDKVAAVMAYATYKSGDPEQVQAYTEYLKKKYGLDQKAIDQYAISGAAGGARHQGEGYGNIYELYQELERQKAGAVDRLAGADYDYERMAEYEQMLADAEEYARKQQEWETWAKEHPVLSSIDSVLMSPFQGVDYLKTMAGGIGHSDTGNLETYVPMNVYNMDATNYVSTVRGTVSEGFNNNVASFLYQTGMSIADSATQVAAFGSAATLFMGASAASNQAKYVIERGGTNEQAFWGGLAAGAAEVIFEKVSIDQLLKPKTVAGMKDLLRETVRQAGVEASEEMLTEVANIITDANIMEESSDFDNLVRQYMLQGMNEEDARGRAILDCIGQVALAGLGGVLSGAAMGGTVNTFHYYAGNGVAARNTRNLGQQFQQMGGDVVAAIIQEGLSSDPSTGSYQMAQKLQEKVDAGKTVTAQELGQLYQANVETISQEQETGAETENADAQAIQNPALRARQQLLNRAAVEEQQRRAVAQQEQEALEVKPPEAVGTETQETRAVAQEGHGVIQNPVLAARQVLLDQADRQAAGEAQQQEELQGLTLPKLEETASARPANMEPITAERTGNIYGQQTQQQAEGGGDLSGLVPAGTGPAAEEGAVGQQTSVPAAVSLPGRDGRWGRDVSGRGRVERVPEAARQRGGTRENRDLGESRRRAAADQPMVSASDVGVAYGTEEQSLQILPRDSWDAEIAQGVAWAESKGVRDVTVVVGPICVEVDGSAGIVQAVMDRTEQRIVIRADGVTRSFSENLEHEVGHLLSTMDAVRAFAQLVKSRYKEAAWRPIYDTYQRKWAPVTNYYEGMTPEEVELYVFEEMMADAYSETNRYGTRMSVYAGEADAALDGMAQDAPAPEPEGTTAAGNENAEATERTTGPPTGQERFSYGGRYANQADSESLAEAERLEMQGVDPETIRQETGWFRGADDLWRFEIDDSSMEYSKWGDMLREDRAEYARFRALEGKFIEGTLTEEEQAELRTLIDHGNGHRRADEQETQKLSDFIQHEELFKNYPQLRQVGLRFAQLPDGTRGSFNGRDITLDESLRDAPEDTLIHEVQHAIQKAEGFASGASPAYWKEQINQAHLRTMEARYAFRNSGAVAELYRRIASGELDEDLYDEELTRILERDAEARERYGEMRSAERFENQVTGAGTSSIDLYRNTAGEVEARDAAARRTMTAEQRRETRPDTGNEDTVFAKIEDWMGDLDQEYGPQMQEYLEIGETDAQDGINHVADMEPVSSITGDEFRKGETDLISQVEGFFNEQGKQAYSPQLGEVILDRRGVKSDIGHGIGRKKAAAFAAVPDIIAQGKVVDYQRNWKDRGYDTAVIAAPIQIGGQPYLAGVVVVRSRLTNRFYLHEVLAENDGAAPFKTGAQDLGKPGGDTPSVVSILRKIQDVKRDAGQTAQRDRTEGARYSINEDSQGPELTQEQKTRHRRDQESTDQEQQEKGKKSRARRQRTTRPVAESLPILAKKDLRQNLLGLFSIPAGQRAELGTIIDQYADRLLKTGTLTEQDRTALFDRMYASGVMEVPADNYFRTGRDALKGGRIYVSEQDQHKFGDDWNNFRKRAFANGIFLTNNPGDQGIDQWNMELADMLPGLFDMGELDSRKILERIVQVAEEGKDEKVSLEEYIAQLAEEEYISEDQVLDDIERKMDWALRTFAEKANLEIHLRDRTGVKIAQERERFAEYTQKQRDREMLRRAKERDRRKAQLQRQRENRELRKLQQRTLKQLQWLSKNRFRAPEELKAAWDEVLGDIDIYAAGAANEMNWSKRYGATWQDLAQMYKEAQKNDPNFLPSKELERIVMRLDGEKIADMDLSALQDLYQAAVGIRTEFYNRNNVINDEMGRVFAEIYADAKQEIETAPGGYSGGVADRLMNLEQLTPMNILERMGGWNPDGAFYSMAKQLEKGERDVRAYTVEANRYLEDFLTEHADWVKRADGQGKDAIWYELEVPELLELRMGDKPIFGDTKKVYMTPSQKVHLYLESKNTDNLRHMTGGRTFVNRDLYSQGKRQEALAQGTTIRLAPETVKKIVSDLTEEEMELARLLENYYNDFAARKINTVSNALYGYDKAMSRNYAPIYTNKNYTKSEIGVFNVTAEGVGNLKARQYAANPSYNIGAFDAFERHVEQTARFVGMSIPARNWQTLLNWREQNNSTGDIITHKWGEEGKRYITDLIERLQGGGNVERDTVSTMADKLLSKYISAIFGANPSIVTKQFGSIFMAMPELGIKNIPSPAQLRSIDRNLIAKYTSELAWRGMGYATPETKQLKDNPNWTQTNRFTRFTFGGGSIIAADQTAASVLWPWAENKVRRENPGLEVGTREQIDAGQSPFYHKVAQEFNDAVNRSQSVSDEIHQGKLRKSRNPITRTLTMFKSDSAQGYNQLRQRIGEARYYARSGADVEIVRRAKRAVGAAALGILTNNLWATAITFLIALWKNKGKYYRDDEDELTAESVGMEMASTLFSNLAGLVAGGEELAEVIGNIITGDTWYGIDVPGMEQVVDLIELVDQQGKNGAKLLHGAVDVLNNGGNLMEYLRANGGDIVGGVKDLAQTAATYFGGIPVNNIEAYLLGLVKWMAPEVATAYESAFSSAQKSDLADLTGEALTAQVGSLLDLRVGDTEKGTTEALATLYEQGYKKAVPSDVPSSVSVNGTDHELTPYQQQVYRQVWSGVVSGALDELVASDLFQDADVETQESMLERLYEYGASQAKTTLFSDYSVESWVEGAEEATQAGISTAEWAAYYTIVSKIKNDRSMTSYQRGEAGRDLIRSAELTDQQKLTLYGAVYGSDADSRVEKFRAIMDAGLTFARTMDVYGKYAELEADKEAKAADQATDFHLWLGDQGFTAEQMGTIEEELKFWSMMPGKANSKVVMASDYGIEPETYDALKTAISEIDTNGSTSQDEATVAINSLPGLTTRERAILWQLQNKSWKADKNPFDVATGWEIYDALHVDDKEEEEYPLELHSLSLPTLD